MTIYDEIITIASCWEYLHRDDATLNVIYERGSYFIVIVVNVEIVRGSFHFTENKSRLCIISCKTKKK